mmetsp:Transcript_23527/g.51404  ORF Transcript_23527/g.51404 Transcript_23527/m.51404 type:complete len:209 (+) Transcript_23527:713-1339(+)
MHTVQVAATSRAALHKKRTCFGAPTATSQSRAPTLMRKSYTFPPKRSFSTRCTAECTWTQTGHVSVSAGGRRQVRLGLDTAGCRTTKSFRFTSSERRRRTCAMARASMLKTCDGACVHSCRRCARPTSATSCSLRLGAVHSRIPPRRWRLSTKRRSTPCASTSTAWRSPSSPRGTGLTTTRLSSASSRLKQTNRRRDATFSSQRFNTA